MAQDGLIARCVMDPLACVNLPALPLQLLLQGRPEWSEEPVVVVAEEKPLARILWANDPAKRCRVFPGLTYAHGLSRVSRLRAGVVETHTIDEALRDLTRRLRSYTPHVEPGGDPGLFWLDASGVSPLYPSLEAWVQALYDDLHRARFNATIVVGFTRFGTSALARSRSGIHIIPSPETESVLARRVQLTALGPAPPLLETLSKLGIVTLGEFIQLPAHGLYERFGKEAYALHQRATNATWDPLVPEPERLPVSAQRDLDDPESDITRLVFVIKEALDRMLLELAQQKQAVMALSLDLHLDDRSVTHITIEPAAPTLESLQLLDLIRLRLDAVMLAAPIVAVNLVARSVPATETQLHLFVEKPKRDLDAGHRALARLRAEFGPDSVVRVVLAERHLPEAQFCFEPTLHLAFPTPTSSRESPRSLVRRVLAQPERLSHAPHDMMAWRMDGRDIDPLEALDGPYSISGAWWHREVTREYYFAHIQSGALLWVYFDPRNSAWFLHGLVE